MGSLLLLHVAHTFILFYTFRWGVYITLAGDSSASLDHLTAKDTSHPKKNILRM